MGIDYYGVLQITRTADNLAIKKASMALEFHPDRLQQINKAKRVFTLICEAYDVLNNTLRRAVYDQYGEEGLKRGVPSLDGFIEAYCYHGDALRTYKEFFGTASPYPNLLDYRFNPEFMKLIRENRAFVQKQPTIKHTLFLTLTEIFFGGIKKMKINRLVFTDSTRTKTAIREDILTVPFKPGVRGGTEIVFVEQGDEAPNQIPGDIVFVIQECEHEIFERDGDNLLMKQKITLKEALLGAVIVVHTLDDRIIRVPITDVVSPGFEKIVEGEGLPILENYPERGNLIIRFNIEFPSSFDENCKDLLLKTFDLCGGESVQELFKN